MTRSPAGPCAVCWKQPTGRWKTSDVWGSHERVDACYQFSRLKGNSTNDISIVNTPTYIAYHVKDTNAGENSEKRGVWTKVDAAWPNKDGKGFNIVLDVIPLDGRLILREPMERE